MGFRFGDCLLDVRLRELTVGGGRVHLEPQVFDVLGFLVENRDRVVSRDELVDAVWQGRSVSEATIAARIFAARQAVGDSGEAQSVIRTLPRRGFRFVAPVTCEEGGTPSGSGASEAAPPIAAPEPVRRRRPRLQLAAMAAAGALLVGAGVATSMHLWKPRLEAASPERMAFPLPEKPSIAVLPFVSLDGGAAQELIGEALTKGVIDALARNPAAFVVAESSTSAYAGQPDAARRAAEELGVRYIVEGSIRRDGDRVAVAAQLLDAIDAELLWSERYRRAPGDLIAVEPEITGSIAGTLGIGSDQASGQPSGGTRSLEAATAFLQGRKEYLRFGAGNLQARVHYLRALEIDPNYAQAIVALANTYFIEMMSARPEDWGGSLAKIGELERQATRIAPGMPALFSLRSLLALTRGDYDVALTEARAMTALDPNGAEGHYAEGRILFYTGDYEAAVESLGTAIRLNPNERASYSAHLAFAHLALSDIDRAVAILEEVAERWPDYVGGPGFLAIAYQLAGREREARQQAAITGSSGMTMQAMEARFSPMQDRPLAERLIDAARQAGVPG
jgi:TolB-like protein/DNA-binding winged helix-turn-helix (wHTH) protein